MRKFHAWIMRVIKLGVRSIKTKILRKCFGMLESRPILIEFDDLHALCHWKRLDKTRRTTYFRVVFVNTSPYVLLIFPSYNQNNELRLP
jgi:hypothetical protein